MPTSKSIKISKMNFLQHSQVSWGSSLIHRRARGRRVARAGASGWRMPRARGARDPGRPGRGTRAADGGRGRGGRGRRRRGSAAERVPRSVHLRAPRPSGKYRGRLLRPRSRPAAYRPPAAAMTPRPRASATVSAARGAAEVADRLRLPSDVTAWAHSPSRRAAEEEEEASVARTPGLSADARARGGPGRRHGGGGARPFSNPRAPRRSPRVRVSWRRALLSPHRCAGTRGRGLRVRVGRTFPARPEGRPELLRHPGQPGNPAIGQPRRLPLCDSPGRPAAKSPSRAGL